MLFLYFSIYDNDMYESYIEGVKIERILSASLYNTI